MGALRVALFVTALVASSALGQAGDLTAEERAAIARGDLVTREHREMRDGRLWIGGVSYLRVPRAREQVWRAIHDVPRWRDMLPATTETRGEPAAGPHRLVEIHQAYGPLDARYTLAVHFDERAHRCSFALAPGRRHDVRAGHGFLEVHRWHREPDASLIVWAVRADPGDGFFLPLVLDPIQHWLVRVPSTIRAFLEGEGSNLYRD